MQKNIVYYLAKLNERNEKLRKKEKNNNKIK